jgi:crotonobetainyl-CoA:carnitine CoA-transferase CaiB-like acyl-CoA transferase
MNSTKPLTGVTVLDLSRLYPGPLCTLILRDMGAEVIKIEDPTTAGDLLRHYTPKYKDGNSLAFHALNRGKKSIALNLKNQAVCDHV